MRPVDAKSYRWRNIPTPIPIPPVPKGNVSLGMGIFSKAKVNHTLLVGRTTWGTMDKPYPGKACVLYLKIQFWQTNDCQFEIAEGELLFDSSIPGRRPIIVECAPELILGQPWQEHVEKTFEINPQFQVNGTGGGIGSFSKATGATKSYRWSFTLQAHPDELSQQSKLAWKWEEQQKGSDHPFQTPIVAAVVLKHDDEPFHIKPRVFGKLSKHRSRYYGWRNVMFVPIKGSEIPLQPKSSTQNVTADVEGLRKAIEKENQQWAA